MGLILNGNGRRIIWLFNEMIVTGDEEGKIIIFYGRGET